MMRQTVFYIMPHPKTEIIFYTPFFLHNFAAQSAIEASVHSRET
jgi:hypothetical protein